VNCTQRREAPEHNYHDALFELFDYKKNNMSTDMEKGRGKKRARVTRGSRNPKHDKRKRYIVQKPSIVN
jgi:hypothetical protein